jgi:hypothetical protein
MEDAMLTINDCIALSDLSEDEIEAIAEHEHLPEIVACELGNYLVHRSDGSRCIRSIIVDDIKAAEGKGNLKHALKLKLVLKHFLDTHEEPSVC